MQQNSFATELIPPALFALLALIASVVSLVLFVGYTGLSRKTALLAWTCTLIAPALYLGRSLNRSVPVSALAATVFIFTVVPFALRLYSKWRNHWLTEEERAPGGAGMRAWLSLPHLVMAGLVSVSGSIGFGWSLPLLLLLTVGSLVLWPALNPSPVAPVSEAPARHLSAEREKVLSLLEAGKITAEESAELLNALGSSTRAATVPAPPSRGAKLALIGAAIVFLGFLFPWFEIAPLTEVSRIMSSAMPPELSQQIQGMMPSITSAQSGPIMEITGGKIANGLGWFILVGAVASALLPHFGQSIHRSTLQMMRLATLGISSAILLYVASQSLRHVAFGLVITVAGLFVEWIGLMRDEPLRASSPLPVGTEIPTR